MEGPRSLAASSTPSPSVRGSATPPPPAVPAAAAAAAAAAPDSARDASAAGATLQLSSRSSTSSSSGGGGGTLAPAPPSVAAGGSMRGGSMRGGSMRRGSKCAKPTLPDADLFYPSSLKKVPVGSFFCLKGDEVRAAMSEKLFAAFTLSTDLAGGFRSRAGQGTTIPKQKRFADAPAAASARAGRKGGCGGTPHTYEPCSATAQGGRSTAKAVRGAAFSRTARWPEGRADTPGVGDYAYEHVLALGAEESGVLGGTIARRAAHKHTQVQKVHEKPGPGDYEAAPGCFGAAPAPSAAAAVRRGRGGGGGGGGLWARAPPRFREAGAPSPGPGHYCRPRRPCPPSRSGGEGGGRGGATAAAAAASASSCGASRGFTIPRATREHAARQVASYTNLRGEATSVGPGEYSIARLFEGVATPSCVKRWTADAGAVSS